MESEFVFIDGQLWINFLNTQVLEGCVVREYLSDVQTYNSWLLKAGLQSGQSEKSLKKALKLRMVLRSVVEGLIAGKSRAELSLNDLNRYLERDFTQLQFVQVDGSWVLQESYVNSDPLFLIARSAAAALAKETPLYLKKCEADDCLLYFNDVSKSHKRRWCSMRTCGNRAKAAAFYERERLP